VGQLRYTARTVCWTAFTLFLSSAIGAGSSGEIWLAVALTTIMAFSLVLAVSVTYPIATRINRVYRMGLRQALVLVSVLALVGCSMSATQYAVHPDTVATLRSHAGKSVKLTPFTSNKPGKSEIICRLVGMVQTPGGVPFEVYVGDAFRTELLVAGLMSDAAPVTLSGHLERMHFTTGTEAVWELQVSVRSSNGRRLTITEDYGFNWHFIGDQACREATTAMALAVQSLVRKAVQHPEFAGLLTASAASISVPPPPAPTATSGAPMPPTPAVTLATPAPPAPAPPPAPADLRAWAPGKWRSTGGTTQLIIKQNLSWTWFSSAGGEWAGSGSGEIVDGQVLLRGWSEGTDGRGARIPRRPTTLRLIREGDVFAGELQTSRSYRIIFMRE
jgi:hypothetical protein